MSPEVRPEQFAVIVRDIPPPSIGQTRKEQIDTYFHEIYGDTFYRSMVVTDNKKVLHRLLYASSRPISWNLCSLFFIFRDKRKKTEKWLTTLLNLREVWKRDEWFGEMVYYFFGFQGNGQEKFSIKKGKKMEISLDLTTCCVVSASKTFQSIPSSLRAPSPRVCVILVIGSLSFNSIKKLVLLSIFSIDWILLLWIFRIIQIIRLFKCV